MKDHHPIVMFFIFLILTASILFTHRNKPDVKQDINKTSCPVCKDENQLNKEMYLKLARATKKYCSANWFDGSEVCQHLETECFNYCIKTTEKNCRVECESRI